MKFRGWQKTSLIEYPGKVSSVLFAGACNFRCPFCYNTELVLNSSRGPGIDSKEVLAYLHSNRSLYQAVIVTGGEPTLQQELPAFFKQVKDLGLLTGLESNGTSPKMIDQLIVGKLVDFIAMDVKAPLLIDKYIKASGLKEGRKSEELFNNVLKSIRLLLGSSIDYEFRTTVVPGIHNREDIFAVAEHLKGAKKFVLQQFVPGNTLSEDFRMKKPFDRDTLLEIYREIKEKFPCCHIRNV